MVRSKERFISLLINWFMFLLNIKKQNISSIFNKKLEKFVEIYTLEILTQNFFDSLRLKLILKLFKFLKLF